MLVIDSVQAPSSRDPIPDWYSKTLSVCVQLAPLEIVLQIVPPKIYDFPCTSVMVDDRIGVGKAFGFAVFVSFSITFHLSSIGSNNSLFTTGPSLLHPPANAIY